MINENHRMLVAYNKYEKELHKNVCRGKTRTRWRNCDRWRLMRKAYKMKEDVFRERYI